MLRPMSYLRNNRRQNQQRNVYPTVPCGARAAGGEVQRAVTVAGRNYAVTDISDEVRVVLEANTFGIAGRRMRTLRVKECYL
jgi:hypothetical protein